MPHSRDSEATPSQVPAHARTRDGGSAAIGRSAGTTTATGGGYGARASPAWGMRTAGIDTAGLSRGDSAKSTSPRTSGGGGVSGSGVGGAAPAGVGGAAPAGALRTTKVSAASTPSDRPVMAWLPI